MVIRINGEELKGTSLKMSEDGRIMTLTIRNSDKTVGAIAKMLDGKPKIEVHANGGTQAIYQAIQMMTISMEIVGGAVVVTASLQVDALEADTAQALREELAAQAKVVAELGSIIEDQALVIGTQSERITAQGEQIAAQAAVIKAQTTQIEAQGKSLEAMSTAVTQAHDAAQNAANAIAAIEEGIADA